MRRDSDVHPRTRTGQGRRARDRLLSDDLPEPPARVNERTAAANLMLFASDDLRESALALGGMEAFLVRVHQLLQLSKPTRAELEALLDADDVDARLRALDDAMTSLRRSLSRLGTAL